MNTVVEKTTKSYGRLIDAFQLHPKIDYLNKEEVELRKEESLRNANYNISAFGHWVFKTLCPHFLKFTLLIPVSMVVGMITGFTPFLILTAYFLICSTICFYVDCRMHRWQRTLLLNYDGHVPHEARQKALAVMSRDQEVLVFVDFLELDPYLVAVLYDKFGKIIEECYFYAWDVSPRLSTVKG